MALNFAIAIYLIMALGIICDDYFVPVLEMICDALKVSSRYMPLSPHSLHPVGGMGLEWSREVAWVERPFQSKVKAVTLFRSVQLPKRPSRRCLFLMTFQHSNPIH